MRRRLGLIKPTDTFSRAAYTTCVQKAVDKLVTDRLTNDPETVRELRRLASEGEVNESGDAATVSHKEIKGRQVFLRKVSGRWFLEDRQKPAK